MKADLEYFYVSDLGVEFKVKADIESNEIYYKDGPDRSWQRCILTPTDAREVAEMLLKAASHTEDLNRNSK